MADPRPRDRERLLARPGVRTAALALLALVLSVRWLRDEWPRHPGDWKLFAYAGDVLRGREHGQTFLRLYGAKWDLHFGPLSLPFGLLPSSTAAGVAAVLLFGVAVGLVALARPSRAVRIVAPLCLLPVWFDAGVVWSHFDVLLPCLFALAVTVAIARGRGLLGGVLLGIALGTSLNALFFVPILFALPRWRDRLRGGLAAGAVVTLAWLPFVVAAPSATLRAIRSYDATWQDSAWHFVWAYLWPAHTAHIVGLPRAVQTVACLLVMVVVGRKRGIGPALVSGVAVRVALDSLPVGYQLAGLVTAGLVADLLAGGRSPRWAVVTLFAALAPVATDTNALRAADRLLCAVVVIALALRADRPAPAARVTERTPTEVLVPV